MGEWGEFVGLMKAKMFTAMMALNDDDNDRYRM